MRSRRRATLAIGGVGVVVGSNELLRSSGAAVWVQVVVAVIVLLLSLLAVRAAVDS